MPCNRLTYFEYEEEFAKTRTYQFCCNLAKRHLYLKWSGERTIDSMALRNRGQLAPFACYLVFRIGNFAVEVTEII
jgi:hypothetical protein